jgi:hypothetical protein
VKKFCKARISVLVKAAAVMESEVENVGKAASTDPDRTFRCNCARNSGSAPAQSFTLAAQPGASKLSRITTKFCNQITANSHFF